jgi:hypothetical protein
VGEEAGRGVGAVRSREAVSCARARVRGVSITTSLFASSASSSNGMGDTFGQKLQRRRKG